MRVMERMEEPIAVDLDLLTRERVADSIKLCVLDSQAPKELSTYLRLHTQAEETFATVKRKIQDYLQAIDQSGPVPMEVGFVRKKGKKGKKGKGKQPKGCGKQNKGKDKQPQDKNQHKAHTGKGQGNPALRQLRQVGPPAARVLGEVDQQSGGQHLGKQQLEGGDLQQLR